MVSSIDYSGMSGQNVKKKKARPQACDVAFGEWVPSG